MASFILNKTCTTSSDDPGPYNFTPQAPPCSLNSTVSPYNVLDPPTTYRLVVNGLTNLSSSYNEMDFSELEASYEAGKGVDQQVVTHYDNKTNELHAFFIDVWSLQEIESYQSGKSRSRLPFIHKSSEATTYGQDFVGTTTSVVTNCISATQSCNIHVDEGKDGTVRYNCSEMFHGNLNSIPQNGIDKMNGWNTSFYHLDDGTPRAISVASRLNPFTYNVSIPTELSSCKTSTNIAYLR
jgi:hypothetical protein